MANVSRRKLLVSGGAVALAATASVAVGEAFSAQPSASRDMTGFAEVSRQDELSYQRGEPLNRRIVAAMAATGIKNDVAAGYVEEGNYYWARWSPNDGPWHSDDKAARFLGHPWREDTHLLVGVSHPNFHTNPDAYIRGFVQMCRTHLRVLRAPNGTIPKVAWEPVDA